MKASPLTLKEMREHERARRWRRLGRRLLAVIVALALVCTVPTTLVFSGNANAAEPVKGTVRVFTDGGFTRLVFRFDEVVEAKVRVSGAIMVISFKKPVNVSVDQMNAGARDYISAARRDPDGSAIRIALARKIKVNSIPAAERFYVDLLPETWTGVLPGLPQDVVDELAGRAHQAERELHKLSLKEKQKKTPTIRVKVAALPTFIRYVFDIPEKANVVPERNDGKLTLNFDQQIRWDLADAQASMPSTLESIKAEVEFDSVAIVFQLNGAPEVRSFREDHSIVVDIGRGGDAAMPAVEQGAANQKAASETLPVIAPPETVPAKDPPGQAAKPAKEKASASPPPQIDAAIQAAAAPPPRAAEVIPPPKAAAAPSLPAKPDAAPKPAAAMAPLVPALSTPVTAPSSVPNDIAKPATAAGAPPAPNPNAPVVTVVSQSGDNLRLEFPFAVPTPAAVFRRADTLWLVFDSAAKVDLAALAGNSIQAIRNAVFTRGNDGEGIVHIRLARPRLVSLDTDGPSWIVNIGDTVKAPTRPLIIARTVGSKNQASIVIPFDDAHKVHRLTDSEIGDHLMVITALGTARGFLKAQDFVELHALPSVHGVVVQPIADDVAAELKDHKIIISRPGGLSLSSTAVGQQEQQTSHGFRALVFDTQVWGFDRQAPFAARQAELIRLAAEASPAKRRQARFNLARFYLSREFAAEAMAVLNVTQVDQRGADDVTGSVLKAVADVMLDRPEEALKELSNPQIGDQQDAPIWRAFAYARQGKWPEAHAGFKAVRSVMGAMPIELQRKAMLDAMRSAIEVNDFAGAKQVVNEFETVGVPPSLAPSIAVLSGRLYQSLGRNEDALTSYRDAAASSDRRAAAQGRLREIELQFQTGDMPRKEVIYALETLTTVWRGDETETEGLKLLAHLYTEDGRYRDAFHVMRTAMLAHPNSDMTRKIQDEAAKTFDSLFLAGKGDTLPPIEALGLFYDYRELTPIGRRGDEMIRRLADRLVSVDLLDQAAELLQHQVDHRLQGAARAQVATHLAIVYLKNRKPDRALTILQKTRMSGLSNELRDQRLLLEAQAMSDIGRHGLALELIANIKGGEVLRLRSNILWAAKRWREAAEQIELLYGERWQDFTPLNEGERFDILRAAIGYALDEETISLLRLREKYVAKMTNGPDRRAFDVVSAPIGTSGPEFQNIAKKVVATNTLDAFLRDLRARYPDPPAEPEGDTAEDAAKGAAAPAAPPPAPDKPPGIASKAEAPEKAVMNAPSKPAAPPLPSKGPVGVPLKPDRLPTGSIRPRLPQAVAR